jgi:hypothetical protein
MKNVLLVCLLGLAIALELALFIAMVDDSRESFDPRHPATLLPVVAGRLDTLRSEVERRVRELIDRSTAAFRERIEHETQTPSPVQ